MGESDRQCDIEAAKHLWDIWQYRHGFFWGAVVRWGAAVAIVSAIPHIKPSFRLPGHWVLVFPAMAFLLTAFSSIHLLGEHQRLVAATRKYLEVSAELAPRKPENIPVREEFTFVTGVAVILVYFISLTALSITNAMYLLMSRK